ncbi:cilia- and flagella-associated protein 77 [Thalassophryne amazonica]|uniref:cilia- and flagella-associated protein 77 n=1 Tax=Thalassophryne amazonica TaxID=390379 RepID=UPI0014716E3E|nr:cilia- and flagella-associated protein 77 [Thalassophryne amazonica]
MVTADAAKDSLRVQKTQRCSDPLVYVQVTFQHPEVSEDTVTFDLHSSPVFQQFWILSLPDMSLPRVGVVRDSMRTNPRIIQVDVGQSLSRGFSLPGPHFTNGISSSSPGDGGVAEALSSWRVVTSERDSPAAVDFVALNRAAVKSGMVTAKEMREYHAQRGGASKKSACKQFVRATQQPAEPDVTFGLKNRPPSPLTDVLSHQYARQWLDKQLSRDQTCNQRLQGRKKAAAVADTRSSLLRATRVLPQTHTEHKQANKVAPALDTFRKPEAHLHAFRTHESNSKKGAPGADTDGLH